MSSLSVKPTIVVVDDDKAYRETSKEFLHHLGYPVLMASNPSEAMQIAYALTEPGIFLIDYHMPGTKGLLLMKKITETSRLKHVCLLVTGCEDHNILAKVWSYGGYDYFSKNPPPKEGKEYNVGDLYAKKIEQVVWVMGLMAKAYHDPLTKLQNLAGMQSEWEVEWKHAKRGGTVTSAIYMDFRKFKWVNDTYGHAAGNRVLSFFGGCLSTIGSGSVRQVDIRARIGGDEFVILLPDTQEAGAVEVVERLRDTLKNNAIQLREKSEPYYLEISCGIAELYSHELGEEAATALDVLLKRADEQMYNFKQGRPQLSLRHLLEK